jgi:hypothetical protein
VRIDPGAHQADHVGRIAHHVLYRICDDVRGDDDLQPSLRTRRHTGESEHRHEHCLEEALSFHL